MPCVSDGYYPSFEDQVRKELNIVRAIAANLVVDLNLVTSYKYKIEKQKDESV